MIMPGLSPGPNLSKSGCPSATVIYFTTVADWKFTLSGIN